LLVLTVLYYIGVRLSLTVFAHAPGQGSLLCLSAGVGLIMAMAIGWRALPLIALASFAANAPEMSDAAGAISPWGHGAISAVANGAIPCVAAALMRWRLPSGLVEARDLTPFSLYGCLVPALIGALVIAGNLVWDGYVTPAQGPGLVVNLIIANGLGILLVWPLYQFWSDSPALNTGGWGWLTLALAANLGLFFLAARGYGPVVFLVLPVLLMLIVKTGTQGVLLALLLTVAALIAGSALVPGPCTVPDKPAARPMMMGFVFAVTYVTLALSLYYRQLLASDSSRLQWRDAALHDSLTQLANRRALLKELADEHSRTQRTGRPFALAMLDIDHFKDINDRFGHQAGDEVLKAVAELLRSQCRDLDIPARIGGEEFAIVFPETSAASALPALERIRRGIAALDLGLDVDDIRLTISTGVADAGEAGGVEALMEEADARLYRAKRSGRNRIVSEGVTS